MRPTGLYELCDVIQYKSGWTFNVMETSDDCYTLAVVITTIDAYRPEDIRPIMHYAPIPTEEPESWNRWLLDRIVKIETHEACEFFQIDGVRPFAPSHDVGEAPYIITEKV